MKLLYIFCLFISLTMPALGQFPPQAGVAGSTALPAGSSLFTAWAKDCSIQRGFLNIDSPSLGYTSFGDSNLATGSADNSVVSLGDSGVATLTFPGFIYNGPGPDFAVFENGFVNPGNDSQAFLELAFVEVSSDGEHFFRFPNQSLTQAETQIRGAGDYMYANLINNLAGKYGNGYGTPFDLEELSGMAGLNLNMISHVRIVDVIGTTGTRASPDSYGRTINDPYPTSFPTGGFDLDAVGVINRLADAHVQENGRQLAFHIFPNPATTVLNIEAASPIAEYNVTIFSRSGNLLLQQDLMGRGAIDLDVLTPGLYFIHITDTNGNKCTEKLLRW
ncbi:MAG: T9SS type A sorting domain-containing protein [Taibaiella sp.]|nr:T9SS type A sorting domain-containing protein [Taibaiella sp.]